VWDAIVNGIYAPKSTIDGETVDKLWSEMNEVESKKSLV